MLDRVSTQGVRLILAALPAKRGPVVLTLHNVSPEHDAWLASVILRIHNLYGFAEPRELGVDSRIHPRKQAVFLTFDDGFASNRRVAEEVLAPLGVRAIFFVTRKFIGLSPSAARDFAQNRFYPKRAMTVKDGNIAAMSWHDLEWLAAQGHEIGAHTDCHPALASLTVAQQRSEIVDGADRLEQRLGRRIGKFAYPFGSLASVNDASIEIVRTRFDMAFSNIRGIISESPSPHFLFRQNLVPGSPRWMMEAIVEGRLDWRYRSVRRAAQARFVHCGAL